MADGATRLRERHNAGTMRRRLMIAGLSSLPVQRLFAQEQRPRPHYKVSAGQLFEAMAARFPVRLGLAGILQLQVSAPRLLLLPARNRVGATLLTQLDGVQLPQRSSGELDLLFALRYEAADQTVRAHHPEIADLRWPGLPAETRPALQALLPAVAPRLGELVLHKFSPAQLAVAQTMGFEPEEFTVMDDGLMIFFGPKARG
ncbi:MAG: hypothetical protein JWP22_11 [Ramlibacter sp.]|nr:hypothetical protein [Ramlibacter sp.]MDB5911336.1 hypothetical protein [Ramlibacter sp.]